MSWIQGYNPDWVLNKNDAQNLIEVWADKLIGKVIDETYVGWYMPDNTWYEDFPIILMIDGQQIEICWQQFDSLSITNNQIILNNCISYDEKVPYKKNAVKELNAVLGKKILNVKLGMSSMTIEDKVLPIINSVDFELDNGFLRIFNALDENGVSNVPANV